MQNNIFRNFWTVVENTSHDIVRTCRRLMDVIAEMPWPVTLVVSIALALALSILPLVLLLFILFMAAKVVIGAFVIDSRRARSAECKD